METVIRITVIYLAVLFGMRVIGKREFSQLAPHEFVVLLMIPEIVSSSLNQNDKTVTNALIGLATVLTLVFLTSVLTHRSKAVERLVSDSAAVLVHRGHVFEDVLNRERISPEEIMAEARQSGIDAMEKIRWAVLESDGKISIVPEEEQGEPQKGSQPIG